MRNLRRIVSEFDFRRAASLLRSALAETASDDSGSGDDKTVLRNLAGELDRAAVVDSTEIPADVVTLHSHVLLETSDGQNRRCLLTLTRHPISDRRLLSVVDPLGVSILGRRVGDTVTVPQKPPVHIRALLYQPEAAGEFHR